MPNSETVAVRFFYCLAAKQRGMRIAVQYSGVSQGKLLSRAEGRMRLGEIQSVRCPRQRPASAPNKGACMITDPSNQPPQPDNIPGFPDLDLHALKLDPKHALDHSACPEIANAKLRCLELTRGSPRCLRIWRARPSNNSPTGSKPATTSA
jgi:hypothetical protein